MTKETISETAALKALLSETADHQILAEMLGFVADRLMALGVIVALFRRIVIGNTECFQRVFVVQFMILPG